MGKQCLEASIAKSAGAVSEGSVCTVQAPSVYRVSALPNYHGASPVSGPELVSHFSF